MPGLASGRAGDRLDHLLHDAGGGDRRSVVHVGAGDDAVGTNRDDVGDDVVGHDVVATVKQRGGAGRLGQGEGPAGRHADLELLARPGGRADADDVIHERVVYL